MKKLTTLLMLGALVSSPAYGMEEESMEEESDKNSEIEIIYVQDKLSAKIPIPIIKTPNRKIRIDHHPESYHTCLLYCYLSFEKHLIAMDTQLEKDLKSGTVPNETLDTINCLNSRKSHMLASYEKLLTPFEHVELHRFTDETICLHPSKKYLLHSNTPYQCCVYELLTTRCPSYTLKNELEDAPDYRVKGQWTSDGKGLITVQERRPRTTSETGKSTIQIYRISQDAEKPPKRMRQYKKGFKNKDEREQFLQKAQTQDLAKIIKEADQDSRTRLKQLLRRQ